MFQAAQMYKNNMDYGRVPRALSDKGVQCDGAASRISRVVEAATKNCRRTRDM